MSFEGVCLNCFHQRGSFEVCPYCGYVAGSQPVEGYVLAPGTRLWGRYVIGTVLGAGGFGITYRAWDTRLNSMVAIKEFFPQSLVSRIPGEVKVRVFSGDKQASYMNQLARFMDEAKNLAKFTGDANIVSVLDYFEDNGTAYIVMEYLDGLTLKEYQQQAGGRLPVQQALVIETALLKALTAIHAKGIIHRDISPDNIFILRDSTIKVLDFGAARFAAKEGSDLTQGVVVKKGYAPPEQYRSNMKQGVWTDIYAAGATLYKMVTGITPEESIERSEKDVLRRPSQTGTAVDAAVDKAVMKAMALRPELRFKSAEAMLAALENRTVVDFPEEELKKRKKRNGFVLAASVLLVVALGALVAWRAANAPQSTILGEPTFVTETIEPDTIAIMVPANDEPLTQGMTHIAEVFMNTYPQYSVEIRTYDYSQREDEAFCAQFATADSPAIFTSGIAYNHIDQDETPYMLNLAPFYASLDMKEYLFLDEILKKRTEDNDGVITYLPMGFNCMVACADGAQASARGVTLPTVFDDFDQIVTIEKNSPGAVNMSPYGFGMALGATNPEIGEKEDAVALERYLLEYVDMYLRGHYHIDSSTPLDYPLDTPMMEFTTSYTTNISGYMGGEGGRTLLPMLSDGRIDCSISDSFAVSAHVTQNKQNLALLFLTFAIGQQGQEIYHVQNPNCQPLNRAALDSYVQLYPSFSFLTESGGANLHYGTERLYTHSLDEYIWNLDEEERASADPQAIVDEYLPQFIEEEWGDG